MTARFDRRAFEEWITKGGVCDWNKKRTGKNGRGVYFDPVANHKWKGWLAALSWERKNRWKTIDSAPRDGTPILIGCDRTQSIRWAVWSDGMWRDGQAFAGGRVSGVPSPTHWRHLPELPK
jgi:hypothetical protein